MRLTKKKIAVLDRDKDGLLSCWVDDSGRLDHDGAIELHYTPHIKPGDVVIDAGAAIGDHTIAYIRATGDPSLVHAFEPHPLMLECLEKNCPDCCIHPIGLSDEFGTAKLWHLNSNAGGSYIGDNTNHDVSYDVDVGTLDNCWAYHPKLNFIKMDIEGYECKAIKGGIETLKRCKPKMMLEVQDAMLKRAGTSAAELFQLLSDLGYKWRQVMGETDRGEYFCYV